MPYPLAQVLTFPIWIWEPNWATNPTMRFAFKTTIFQSRSGREQRRAVRAQPRKFFNFTLLEERDDYRAARQHLYAYQNALGVMPDWTKRRLIPAGLPINSGAATVSKVASWLVAGQQIIQIDGAQREVRQISSVSGTTVTFTTNTTKSWSTQTVLYPALVGLLEDNISADLFTAEVGDLDIGFSVDPGSEVETEETLGDAYLSGREVFTKRPNMIRSLRQGVTWPVETTDFGYGVVKTQRPIDFPSLTHQGNYLVTEQDDSIEYITAFFKRMRGKRGEFWCSTEQNDLRVVADLIDGDNKLSAAGTDIYTKFADADPLPTDEQTIAIQVVTTSGQTFNRVVDGIAIDTVNNRSVLTVKNSWPSTVSSGEVERVSWLLVSRLATDECTIDYVTDGIARVSLSFTSIKPLIAEPLYSGFDESMEWILEVWGTVDAMKVFFDLDYAVNTLYPSIFD